MLDCGVESRMDGFPVGSRVVGFGEIFQAGFFVFGAF